MSNNQAFENAAFKRGRPTRRPERPHFRPVRNMVYSLHEQAVLDAGYPWVRTNPLQPTWQAPDADPRSDLVPDRLNYHGHHGVNTHLIVEGDLTIMKLKKMFSQNHISAITLSTQFGAQRELSVAPDEMYAGTTQQSCKFVEGHRSLSPASACRYMTRGSLEWVDKTGKAVRGADRAYILEQLRSAQFHCKFDFNVMRRVATCTFKDDNQVTRGMSQWFTREWNDPAVQAAKGDLRPVIHPLEIKSAAQREDQEKDAAGDGMDVDEDDIAAGLIKAFEEWLPGHVDET